MPHSNIKIKSLEAQPDYKLTVTFADGVKNLIDISPLLHTELYAPLRDYTEFQKAHIDDETGAVVWSCGADFDPDTLYHWDKYQKTLIQQYTSDCHLISTSSKNNH